MRRLTLLLVALGLLAACGVPTDGTPRDLAADRLPDALAPEASPTTTTEPPVDADPVPLTVYLVDGETQLVRQTVRLAPDDSVTQMITELRRLTDDDREAGFRTLITDEVAIERPTEVEETAEGNVLRLALSEEFYALEGQNRSLAAAQIVFTVTAPARFDAVLFLDAEEQPQLIPTSAGELPDDPRAMTRQDFDGFNALVVGE
ncbi:MAG: GerMN domain-containing protein [Actinomycetota bacterium]